MRAVLAAMLCLLGLAGSAQQQEPVTIRVDTSVRKGPMHPFWAWYGHDEERFIGEGGPKSLTDVAHYTRSPCPYSRITTCASRPSSFNHSRDLK